MAQLRQDYPEFIARDIEIVVVGPEDAAAFTGYFGKESLPFVGLPDPKGSVLKLYGQEVNLFKLGACRRRFWWIRPAWPATSTTGTA